MRCQHTRTHSYVVTVISDCDDTLMTNKLYCYYSLYTNESNFCTIPIGMTHSYPTQMYTDTDPDTVPDTDTYSHSLVRCAYTDTQTDLQTQSVVSHSLVRCTPHTDTDPDTYSHSLVRCAYPHRHTDTYRHRQ